MSKDMEQKVMMLLRALAKPSNWRLQRITDKDGKWIRNELLWEKESYDPMYVAQDLLDEISV